MNFNDVGVKVVIKLFEEYVVCDVVEMNENIFDLEVGEIL